MQWMTYGDAVRTEAAVVLGTASAVIEGKTSIPADRTAEVFAAAARRLNITTRNIRLYSGALNIDQMVGYLVMEASSR